MTKTPKQRIDGLLDKVRALLDEAVTIADEYGEDFYWNGPNHSYGFGGRYKAAITDWQASTGCSWEQSDQNREGEWLSSSHDC